MSYQIKTHIDINASLTVIWEILTNCNDYCKWNPFIVEAHGVILPNSSLILSPKITPTKQTTFQAKVTQFNKYSSFTWTGAIGHKWFALGDHSFKLTLLENGKIRVHHDECFRGLGCYILGAAVGNITKKNFETMNEALKAYAECSVAAPEFAYALG